MVEDSGLGGHMLERVTISYWWGYKGSGDATNTQINENISDPTANVTTNVIVSPTGPIPSGSTSYAKLVTSITSMKSVNFRTLITPARNGDKVVVPLESIRAISEQIVNTTYIFLRKRVAYPVVANYFRSMDGLDVMLENGLWFIRNNPLILKKWNLDVNLMKDVGNVSVWVKLHGVLVIAFSEDGLSAIATELGTLLMLDSYTSDMCIQSWGRSSYARALIKIRADVELKDTIVVVMPKLVGDGFYICTIRVKYEWKSLRCACYKVFSHVQEECPNNRGSGVAKNLKNPS
nr:hypothetical protein [Tanacetum cinerariifolium]